MRKLTLFIALAANLALADNHTPPPGLTWTVVDRGPGGSIKVAEPFIKRTGFITIWTQSLYPNGVKDTRTMDLDCSRRAWRIDEKEDWALIHQGNNRMAMIADYACKQT